MRHAFLIMVIALLSACDGTIGPSRDVSGTSGRGFIEDYTLGVADISVVVTDSAGRETEVGQGAISSTGEVSFTITRLELASPILSGDFVSEEPCSSVSISDTNARGTGAGLRVKLNGRDIGGLLEFTRLSVTRASFIFRTYADRAVSMRGSCPGDSDSLPVTYDLNYRTGWNLVFLADAVGGGLILATDFETLTAEDVEFVLLSTSSSIGSHHVESKQTPLVEQIGTFKHYQP